jgi:hypothetical protein
MQLRRRAAPRGILHRSRSRSRRCRCDRTGNAGPAVDLRRRAHALPCSSCHWPGRPDRRARVRSAHTPRRLPCTRRLLAMPPRCMQTPDRGPSIAVRAGCTVARPRSAVDRTPGSRAARLSRCTRRAASPSRRSRTGSSCIASSEVVATGLQCRGRSSPDPVIASACVFDCRAGPTRSLILNPAAWIAATCEMSRAPERRKRDRLGDATVLLEAHGATGARAGGAGGANAGDQGRRLGARAGRRTVRRVLARFAGRVPLASGLTTAAGFIRVIPATRDRTLRGRRCTGATERPENEDQRTHHVTHRGAPGRAVTEAYHPLCR